MVSTKPRARRRLWAGVLALLLIIFSGAMIGAKNLYDGNFPRFEARKYTGHLRYVDVTDYGRSLVTFASGKNALQGYLYGEGNAKGLVVITPGLGEGADDFLSETLYFVDRGWRVFSFDPTGSFASEGKSGVGLPQSLRDMRAALDYVGSTPTLSGLPLVLYGHSWGGYAVTAVLDEGYDVAAVASLATFNAPAGLAWEDTRRELGLLAPAAYPFVWLYQTLLFGRDSIRTAVEGINASGIPVMVIHGSADESIFYDGASIIAQRARITNPNVTYKTCSAEGRNGHNTLAQSAAATAYIDKKNREYQGLLEQYGGTVPDNVRDNYYAQVDRFLVDELDADLMSDINSFFEAALQGD